MRNFIAMILGNMRARQWLPSWAGQRQYVVAFSTLALTTDPP
jgi:hypothetical protein